MAIENAAEEQKAGTTIHGLPSRVGVTLPTVEDRTIFAEATARSKTGKQELRAGKKGDQPGPELQKFKKIYDRILEGSGLSLVLQAEPAGEPASGSVTHKVLDHFTGVEHTYIVPVYQDVKTGRYYVYDAKENRLDLSEDVDSIEQAAAKIKPALEKKQLQVTCN